MAIGVRSVMTGRRLIFMTVRPVGAKVDQVKRRGDRRQAMEQKNIFRRVIDRAEVTQRHPADIDNRPSADVTPEDQPELGPRLPRIVRIEIRIGCRAGVQMMCTEDIAQLAPAKFDLDEQQGCTNHAIYLGLTKRQQSVLCIMRRNEQVGRQPVLDAKDGQHGQPVAGGDSDDWQCRHMRGLPTAKGQRKPAQPDQGMPARAGNSLTGTGCCDRGAGKHRLGLLTKIVN